LLLDIRLTTGAKMYATSSAKMNGSTTCRARNRTRMQKARKPHSFAVRRPQPPGAHALARDRTRTPDMIPLSVGSTSSTSSWAVVAPVITPGSSGGGPPLAGGSAMRAD
jgi:hypothetical protein